MIVAPHDEFAQSRRSRWPLALALLVAALLLVTAGAAAVLARLGRPFIASPFNATPSVGVDSDNPAYLTKLAGQAVREIEKVHPKGTYIVVDSYRNQLHLIQDGKVIRSAVCSTTQRSSRPVSICGEYAAPATRIGTLSPIRRLNSRTTRVGSATACRSAISPTRTAGRKFWATSGPSTA